MKDKKNTPARRALRVAGMSLDVAGSYLGYLAQRAFLGEEKREAKLKSAHGRAARRMRDEMQTLRGPVMKLGQALSLQGGVLPDEAIAEFATLQMQAPGMHPSLIRAQFRGSMGRDPEDVFRSFEPEPFAAASLGQVHRALTRDGEHVAVKIQYPGIRSAVENDFKWFRTVSRPAQATGHLPKSAIDELQEQIVAETDYVREADNIDFFRARLEPLRFVRIPRVYRDLSSDQVLTMSLLPGRHLGEFLARRPSQKLRDAVGEHLFELFYFQLLRIEAFHADPHAGNYLIDDDGSISLVDFGCVKYLTAPFVASMRELYLYPGARDSAHFRSLLDKRHALFGAKLRPAVREALIGFTENFYRAVYPPEPEKDGEAHDFGKGTAVQDYMRESQKLWQSRGIMPEYIFLARSEMGMYDTLQRLGARVHTSRIVRKHLEPELTARGTTSRA
jgi:predicted unusual protein kinase regulating ubiquinone biosynthesis (AarF/ABC1/UbiB family)